MAREYRAADADTYKMIYDQPHRELEPLEDEVAVVDRALATLVEMGALPHADYDGERLLAHRRAVAERFEIPWTAITPRMQRLIYAINAIHQPACLLAAGIFCGNTFISNAGAAVGPGKVYDAERLVGVEIDPDRAALARRNVALLAGGEQAEILAEDAVDVAAAFDRPIDLLYLDADGDAARGKGIYHDITLAALDKLRPGSLVLAHNSVNCAERLQHYLAYVRDAANFRDSVNMVIDGEGLEVSVR